MCKLTRPTDIKINSFGYPAFWDHEFSYFKKPVRNLETYSNICLLRLADLIASDKFKPQCETLRSFTDSKQAREYKANNFDYVTPSGSFSKRNADSLISHSGLICIDLDGLENLALAKTKLSVDPETVMLFTSPGGTGLKWITHIDTTVYDQETWYRGLSGYLKSEYNLDADPSCKDLARACFISHDTFLYLNPAFA